MTVTQKSRDLDTLKAAVRKAASLDLSQHRILAALVESGKAILTAPDGFTTKEITRVTGNISRATPTHP